jgi:hypothetical protein
LHRAIVGEGNAGQLSVEGGVEAVGVHYDLRATVYTMAYPDPALVQWNPLGGQEEALNHLDARASEEAADVTFAILPAEAVSAEGKAGAVVVALAALISQAALLRIQRAGRRGNRR